MTYDQIERHLDLNDPNRGFAFSSDRGGVEVSLVDWRNRTVTFRFRDVYLFHHQLADGYRDFPEATVLELQGSDEVRSLRDGHTLAPDEKVRHIVVSTNEGEWCEVIGGGFDVAVTG